MAALLAIAPSSWSMLAAGAWRVVSKVIIDMKRLLFTILPALSLLLCIAMCALWVRSYWRWDSVGRSRDGIMISLHSGSGYLYLTRAQYEWAEVALMFSWNWQYETGSPSYLLEPRGEGTTYWERVAGIYWRRRLEAGHVREWEVWIAHRNVAIALAVPLLIMFWRGLRKRHRLANTLCPSCGYDLRATPERCPECGATPLVAKGAG